MRPAYPSLSAERHYQSSSPLKSVSGESSNHTEDLLISYHEALSYLETSSSSNATSVVAKHHPAEAPPPPSPLHSESSDACTVNHTSGSGRPLLPSTNSASSYPTTPFSVSYTNARQQQQPSFVPPPPPQSQNYYPQHHHFAQISELVTQSSPSSQYLEEPPMLGAHVNQTKHHQLQLSLRTNEEFQSSNRSNLNDHVVNVSPTSAAGQQQPSMMHFKIVDASELHLVIKRHAAQRRQEFENSVSARPNFERPSDEEDGACYSVASTVAPPLPAFSYRNAAMMPSSGFRQTVDGESSRSSHQFSLLTPEQLESYASMFHGGASTATTRQPFAAPSSCCGGSTMMMGSEEGEDSLYGGGPQQQREQSHPVPLHGASLFSRHDYHKHDNHPDNNQHQLACSVFLSITPPQQSDEDDAIFVAQQQHQDSDDTNETCTSSSMTTCHHCGGGGGSAKQSQRCRHCRASIVVQEAGGKEAFMQQMKGLYTSSKAQHQTKE